MRRILIVLLMLTAGVAHARILHVGDNTIKLSQTKTTTPALHVRVGDEVWYGAMCTNNQKNTLHVKFNNIVYDVIEPFTETTNYIYDESGRLIGANENLYLESTLTQYIDTGIYSNQDTSVEGLFWSNYIDSSFFGARESAFYNTFGFICTGDNKYRTDYNKSTTKLTPCILNQTFTVHKNKNITSIFDNSGTRVGYTEIPYEIFETPISLYLLGFHLINPIPLVSHPDKKMRAYYTKIWDNDTLVRHFVPVPCGLKIGDFVVPENGMWDIVEQKFYGNMGTGDFIYGVDG